MAAADAATWIGVGFSSTMIAFFTGAAIAQLRNSVS